MMKTVSVLFADANSLHIFDDAFDGENAFFKTLDFAYGIENSCGVVIFADCENAAAVKTQVDSWLHKRNLQNDSNATHAANAMAVTDAVSASVSIDVIEKKWTVKILLEEIVAVCRKHDAVAAVYAFADCPFLSAGLAHELLGSHEKYVAEYTFADGYPYGFAPEIIDAGAANILAQLCASQNASANNVSAQNSIGNGYVTRDSIWTLLKTDINSFDIETILSPSDWRLYRFSFSCKNKSEFLACKALADEISGDNVSPEMMASAAVKCERVLKTVPSFYNVAISEKCSCTCAYCPYPKFFSDAHNGAAACSSGKFMDIEKFSALVSQMATLSEHAVVSLSSWGEALSHAQFADFVKIVLSQKGLSVLVETDGALVTDALCQKIKSVCDDAEARTNGQSKIIWIVSLDAFTDETYKKMRGNSTELSVASGAVALLAKYFPGDVFPQMVRTNENEHELENFYRYWSKAESPSGGKIIIQKYDSFCGSLPDRKPADLSPLGRIPCWHLRRDMTILCDGNVPRCHEFFSSEIIGNVFDESVEGVWNKMTLNEIAACKNCDEYYTYNF